MLGWKDGYSFLNTAYPYDPENILSHHGLVGLKLSSSSLIGKYYAPLGDSNPRRPCKFIKFSDWWNENVRDSGTRPDQLSSVETGEAGSVPTVDQEKQKTWLYDQYGRPYYPDD